MKLVVINGTDIRGCTYQLKEIFLKNLGERHAVTEFYLPSEGPSFCLGCKKCFVEGEEQCPHAAQVKPIWDAIMESDVIVFAYPVYALRAPGQVKALLDHLCCHWIAHRPEKAMFTKQAVILTQSLGFISRGAKKDVKTSLNWLGLSNVKTKSFALKDGVEWERLPEKQRRSLERRATTFAQSLRFKPTRTIGIPSAFYFFMVRMLYKSLKKKGADSLDSRHWVEQGWV